MSQVTKNIHKVIDAAHNFSVRECQFPVGSYQNPASSCKEITQREPHSASGYYWTGTVSANIRKTYCDMTTRCNSTGGWMRVAYLNMTNNLTTCPPGFRQISSPKRVCGRTQQSAGCSSVTFSAHSITYSKICGRIIGYQVVLPRYIDISIYHNIISSRHNTIDVSHVSMCTKVQLLGVCPQHVPLLRSYFPCEAGLSTVVSSRNWLRAQARCGNTSVSQPMLTARSWTRRRSLSIVQGDRS